uniref:SGNH hydrolase-type esterase domain-containing protein n=1 Tax=Sander lucioperca TaxID=283035 RepID=A0A8C9XWN1_SANLU
MPWSRVGTSGSRVRAPPHSPPHFNIQLENKFDIFNQNEFPSLVRDSSSLPSLTSRGPRSSESLVPPLVIPERSSRPRTRRSTFHFTPAPSGASVPLTVHRPPAKISPPIKRPSSIVPLPSTLIIGDSIIRNVKSKSSATFCFPGARVSDIREKIPLILTDHPLARDIILHVGCNDISSQPSEKMKRDFCELIDALAYDGKQFFISGPLPPLHGMERFSRSLSINTWLQAACRARNLAFIDNFNLFWKRPAFFRGDGIHPNGLGARILSDNLTGKSVFISGPLPSLGRGSCLFSRLLSLNTWLQLTCSIHKIGFIDNFNLFWERGSLFSRDGIHPNTRGSQMLRGNLHHALHTQTSD